jgi:hypothetical protein
MRFAWCVVAFVVAQLASGCGRVDREGVRITRRTDSDCPRESWCALPEEPGKQVAALPALPCGAPQHCTSNSDCGQGLSARRTLCRSTPAIPAPGRRCASGTALPRERTRAIAGAGADPTVRVPRFAATIRPFIGCLPGMQCDPTYQPADATALGRYSLFGTEQSPDNSVMNGVPIPTLEQLRAIASNCVFLRCNEPGAFACAPGFRCDVAAAPPTSSGCVPIPGGHRPFRRGRMQRQSSAWLRG